MANRPIRYRELQTAPQIDTTHIETGGAETAMALARALKSFAGLASDVGGAIQSKRGAQAGAAAGAAGNPEPKQGFFSGTAYGQAYNTAAEASYLSKTAVDVDSTIDRIEQETQGDQATFTAKMQGYADGLLKSAPKEYHPRIQLMLEARGKAGATRVLAQELEDHRQQQHADFLAGMDARASLAMKSLTADPSSDHALADAVGDNNAQLNVLVKDHVITAPQAEVYRQRFADQIDKALSGAKLADAVDGLMGAARGNVEDGDHALAALQDRADLDAHDKVAIAEEYRKQRGLLEFERSRTHAEESAALSQSLARNAHGPEVENEARRLYKLGAISGEEFEAYLTSSVRNEQRVIEDGADVAAVQDVLTSGHGLDPANQKHVKALTKLFDGLVSTTGVSPGSDRWQTGAIEIARQSNILPESAESWARVNLLSGDPEAASVAASFLDRVHDANPAAARYSSDPKIAAFAEQLNLNLSAGLSPERGYELAHKRVYETTEQQKELLQKQYTKLKVEDGNSSALQSALKEEDHRGLFSRTPQAPLPLRADYENLVQQFYVATNGNLDSARKLAGNAVRSMWGVSSVNGSPEVMKYPPEKLGLSPEIIRADVAETVKGVADPAKVRLVPNGATDRTKGRVWSLVTVDEYGSPDVVRDGQNKPVLYSLPLGHDFERARDAVRAQKIAEAREARERALANAAEQTELEKRLVEYYKTNPSLRNR